MKKIVYLLAIMLYAMAVIGGIGYALQAKAYIIALAILMLGVIAYPQFLKFWKELTN